MERTHPTTGELADGAACRSHSDSPPHGAAATRQSRYEAKRRAYLAVLVLSTLSLLTTTAIDGLHVLYWGLLTPLLGVFNLALVIAIWRRRLSLRAVEALLLAAATITLLGFLATWRLLPGLVNGDPAEIVLVVLWTVITFPLCFLVFGTRRGLWASVAIYVALLVLTAPVTFGGQVPGHTATWPIEILRSTAFMFPMVITLIRVLASRLEDLTAARAQAEVAAHQAHTDPLTNLPNRRHLDDELQRHIALARRHEQPLSVALLDLDHFKSVNDRFGHDLGDQALTVVAGQLTASVRSSDFVGRWGGEEFLLIAPHTGPAAALEIAERCRTHIADRRINTVGRLTASLGVATLAPDDDARTLIRRADLALYTAKTAGRDRVATVPDLVPPRDPRWAPRPTASPSSSEGEPLKETRPV